MELNKIYCMDCLDGMKEMEDNSVDVVLADPPYGIDYQSNLRKEKFAKIQNDTKPFTEWIPDAYRVLRDGGRLLCFYRWDVQTEFVDAINQARFSIKSQIVWDKGLHGMGDLYGEFAPCHESILYATKGRYEFKGARPKTVIRQQRLSSDLLTHPNEKPVGLIIKLLNSITTKEDTVLIPFIGSGVDAEACVRMERPFIGFELEQKYVDIANKRVKPWLQQERLQGVFE